MLIDDITITISGGRGGDGSMHFRREKFIPKGGPDGGNGATGGNVYLLGIEDATSLRQFRYQKELKAQDGGEGRGEKMHGRDGQDLIIKIPVATVVTDTKTLQTYRVGLGEQLLIARGGLGGRGNWEFRSATNQTPRKFEKGLPGDTKILHFSLELIADVGLVGFPNTGKTSLLNKLSNAQAKVGNYPFTTLEPNLGSMDGIILCDIPGLIEQAHTGKGLGFKFLKHVAKAKVLAFCMDAQSPDVLSDWKTVTTELKLYNTELLKKKSLILLTKSDMVSERELFKKVALLKKTRKRVLPVSIYNSEQIGQLKQTLKKTLS